MGAPNLLRTAFRFDVFEVDLRSAELRRKGLRIRLQKQPLELLRVLLERPGEMVTREELRTRLWPGDVYVDFDRSLNKAVARLREALSDSSDTPRYIETLPRFGYRFIARVEEISNIAKVPEVFAEATAPLRSSPTAQTHEASAAKHLGMSPQRRSRYRLVLVGALCAAGMLCLLAALGVLRARGWHLSRSSEPPIQSLAVLPLQNLSGDPAQEYFADGMTDELITNLAKIQALRVISRTSVMHYKGLGKTAPEIAKELGVQAVVEGTVVRSGSSLRITAQLVEVPGDRHLWAESYQRDLQDVLSLQNEIARAIAEQVRVRISPAESASFGLSRPVNPEAYESYLRSQQLLHLQRTSEGARKALEYSLRAVQLDAGDPLSQAGLAEAYCFNQLMNNASADEVMPRALAAAKEALQLNNALPEAHRALGTVLFLYSYDWPGAEHEYKTALAENSNDSETRLWYANYLIAMGRKDDANAEMARALSVDPLSMWVNRDVGRILYFSRKYDLASEHLKKTADLYPDSLVILNWIAEVYLAEGRPNEFLEYALREHKVEGVEEAEIEALKRAYETAGLRGYWKEELRRVETKRAQRVSTYQLAQLDAALGEKDAALSLLEKAFAERSFWLVWVKVDPRMDPLRADPRFKALLRRMNLEL